MDYFFYIFLENIFKEIEKQIKLFQNIKFRNFSIDNILYPKKTEMEIQKLDQISISKPTNSNANEIKINNKAQKIKSIENSKNSQFKNFSKITEENEDPSGSRANSLEVKNNRGNKVSNNY